MLCLQQPGSATPGVCCQNVFSAQALLWHLPEQQRELQQRCNATQQSLSARLEAIATMQQHPMIHDSQAGK